MFNRFSLLSNLIKSKTIFSTILNDDGLLTFSYQGRVVKGAVIPARNVEVNAYELKRVGFGRTGNVISTNTENQGQFELEGLKKSRTYEIIVNERGYFQLKDYFINYCDLPDDSIRIYRIPSAKCLN